MKSSIRTKQNSDPIRPLYLARQKNNRKEAENSNGDSNGSLDGYWFYLSEMEKHGRCDRVPYRTF